ncbi:MAG: radical SAM protein, partial [Acidobacteria bacterium]|nr:radical SAM protein [Acidobacteriota bacterium]
EVAASLQIETLREAGWLVPSGADLDHRFLLKYVSLETHTVCNQSCYFCPVSVDPRNRHFIPTELFEGIVRQLSAFRSTIEAVTLINYNEPTLDKRFVDQVRTLKEAGLPPAVLTNGSGLTPDRIEQIVAMGGMRYLSVNLSTLDRERYRKERGGDHLPQVLKNLEFARDRPVAEEMEIVVLGMNDEKHHRDFAEIQELFEGSRFEVKFFEIMDRAGYLQIGQRPATPHKNLRGCEVVGSRPLQHIHISPYGECVLCCEDYDHKYVVGNLNRQSVEEVLRSPEFALLRRWVYGLDEAPDDFICRRCLFALTC